MPDAAITSQWPANYAFVWIAAHIQPYVQGQADMYQVYMYISSYPVGLVRLFWAALRVLQRRRTSAPAVVVSQVFVACGACERGASGSGRVMVHLQVNFINVLC